VPAVQVVFEPLPPPLAPEPAPHVEILFPYLGKSVPAAHANDYEVRLRVENWSGRVQLALDDYRPVVVENATERVPLGSLVPADRDLAPGNHRLFAVAVDEQGRMLRAARPTARAPFAVVDFRIGSRVALPDERPFIAYSQPRGTYNGDAAADAVFVDFYLVGVERFPGSRVRVQVLGAGCSWSQTLPTWQPMRIRGLPSGDFDVEVTLLDAQGTTIPEVGAPRRTITINRDAPLPPQTGVEAR